MFRAGLVQFDVKRERTASNLSRVIEKIGELGERGAALAVLPEMWSCGFDNRNLPRHAEKTPGILEMLAGLARRHSMVISGTLPERYGDGVCNTAWVVDSTGEIAGSYRKIHLFSATGEDRYFVGGREPLVCDTALGRVGVMTCYDLKFPELGRALVDRGAEMILVSAQWPRQRIDHWRILLRARAIENQLFVLGTNRCGRDLLLTYPGCSMAVSPMGKVLAEAGDTPCALEAEIDLSIIEKTRKGIPSLRERVLG